jgi:hypothetical protein
MMFTFIKYVFALSFCIIPRSHSELLIIIWFQVKLAVFMSYVRSCRFLPVVSTILSYIVYLGSQIGTNVWLSIWSTDPPPFNTSLQDTGLRDLRLGIYGGLGIVQGNTSL